MTKDITNYFRIEHLIGFIVFALFSIFFLKPSQNENNIEPELPSYSEHLDFNIGDHISKIQNYNYDIKIIKNKSEEYNSYKLTEKQDNENMKYSYDEYFIIYREAKIILISRDQYFKSNEMCKIYLDIQKIFLETVYDIIFEEKNGDFFFEEKRRITINNCKFNKKRNKHSFSVKFN